MNTMNPDRLNDRIRTMVQTAVERADAPPTVDAVVAGVRGVTVGHQPVDGGRRRWVAMAAALLLVIAGGVGWWVHDTRRAQVTPANRPTGDSRLGLGTYVLPTRLPAGWALVDISEMAADNAGAILPRLWVLSRPDTGQRAVLAVYPAAGIDTDVTLDGATATTSAGAGPGTESGPVWQDDLYTATGELRWTANGVEVFLAAADETAARTLYDDLQPSTGSAPLTYTLSKTSPYVFEKSLGEVVPSSSGWANLTYADGVGNTVQISLYLSSAQSLPTLLDPDIGAKPAGVRAGENAGETFGYRVVDNQLEVAAYSIQRGAEPVDTAALHALLDSLELVDEQQWDDQITAFSDRIAAQPATSSGSVAGGTVAIHRGAEISGICFTIGGDRGCRPIEDGLFDSPASQDTSDGVVASILVGDRWVYVRGLTPSGPTGPIDIDSMTGPVPMSGGIELGAVVIDGGTFAVLNSPLGIDAVVFSVGPPDERVVAAERIVRPIR